MTGGQSGTLEGGLSNLLFKQGGGIAGLLAKGLGGGSSPGDTLNLAAGTFSTAVDRFSAAVGTTSTGGGSGFTDAVSAYNDTTTGSGGLIDSLGGSGLGLTDGSFDPSQQAGALGGGFGDIQDPSSLLTGAFGDLNAGGATADPAGGGFSAGSIGAAFSLLGNAANGAAGGKKPQRYFGRFRRRAVRKPLAGAAFGPWGALIGGALGGIAGLFGYKGGGIISAARGAIIGGDGQLARLHDNEMVLPANLSKGVQSIIDSNGNTGGGSGNQVHFNISAIDATGFQEHLDKNAGKIYDLFNRGVRTADPRLTKAGSAR